MISIRTSSLIWGVMLATVLQTTLSAQVHPGPIAASLCEVVASPAGGETVSGTVSRGGNSGRKRGRMPSWAESGEWMWAV